MVWGTDRIQTSYAAITALATKPQYLLTFNEPNFLSGGGSSNVVDPTTAASLWPQLTGLFDPLGVQLIAPSPIDCTGDPSCRNVDTAAGWLSAFQTVSSQITHSRSAQSPTVQQYCAWQSDALLLYHISYMTLKQPTELRSVSLHLSSSPGARLLGTALAHIRLAHAALTSLLVRLPCPNQTGYTVASAPKPQMIPLLRGAWLTVRSL